MPTILARHRTVHLGYSQTCGGFHATRYAKDRGRPLNLMATINFERLGVAEEEAGELFKLVREKISRAWRYEVACGRSAGTFDHFHVQENPAGRRNAHWALHIPVGRESWFQSLLVAHFEKLIGRSLPADAVIFKSITTGGNAAKYMLKGVNPQFKEHFFMQDWASDQGIVTGRRFGTSRSLGRTARKANWTRKRRPRH